MDEATKTNQQVMDEAFSSLPKQYNARNLRLHELSYKVDGKVLHTKHIFSYDAQDAMIAFANYLTMQGINLSDDEIANHIYYSFVEVLYTFDGTLLTTNKVDLQGVFNEYK